MECMIEQGVLLRCKPEPSEQSVVLPDNITKIGDGAFENCRTVTSVTLPDGILEIGARAFRECAALEEIHLPDSLCKIGEGAFLNCTALRCAAFPDGITVLADNVLNGCKALSEIKLPAHLTQIGSGAMKGCTSLTSITLPDGLQHIGRFAFYDCTQLASLRIPESVTVIGYSAFTGTRWLAAYPESFLIHNGILLQYQGNDTHITVPDSVRVIGGRAFSNDEDDTVIKQIVLPDGLVQIDDEAFQHCSQLTDITIPAGVRTIGERAFSFCRSLAEITFSGAFPAIGKDAFLNARELCRITLHGQTFDITPYLESLSLHYINSYRSFLANKLLTGDLKNLAFTIVAQRITTDFYAFTESPQLAREIKKCIQKLFEALMHTHDTTRMQALLSHKELLTQQSLKKLLALTIAYTQKTGFSEPQMLVMRANEEHFHNTKPKKIHL